MSDTSAATTLMRQVIDYLVNNNRYSEKRFIAALKAIFILARATTQSSQPECKTSFRSELQPLVEQIQRDHVIERTFCFNKSRLARILEPVVLERKASAEQSWQWWSVFSIFSQQQSASIEPKTQSSQLSLIPPPDQKATHRSG